MPVIQWEERFNVGIKEIDDQHHRLVQMLADLQQALGSDTVDQEMGHVIKELVLYTQEHFAAEEAIMAQIGYADLQHHQELHKTLVRQIVTILSELKSGRNVSAFDLIDFLKKWLVEHILHEDKKIGPAFRDRMKAALANPGNSPQEAATADPEAIPESKPVTTPNP